MGRVIPKGKGNRLDFLRAHLPEWNANVAELGLDPNTLANLNAAFATAQAAFSRQIAKQNEARAATLACDNAIERATLLASALVRKVKGTAAEQHSIEPYALAQIPPPKARTLAPQAPPMPQIVSIRLEAGALVVKWKGRLGETDFFRLHRVEPNGERRLIASLHALSYRDESVPLDQCDVSYFVVAHRRGIDVQSSTVAFLLPRQMARAA